MKLTGKIILMYMLAMVLLTACYGYSIVLREQERLKEERQEEAESVGIALEGTLVAVFQKLGHEGVTPLLRETNDRQKEVAVHWIALNSDQATPALATTVERLKRIAAHTILTVESQDIQHTFYPIDVLGERVGCLEFSQPLSEVHQFTRGTIVQAAVLILGMMLCAGLFTLMGIRSVGERLEKLVGKTEQIARGEFTGPLELRGHDELNVLATALNDMSRELAAQQERVQVESTARLAAVEQLRHVDRLNTVGRLASGVAHELGTPLNVVSGRAELIASGRLDTAESRESALVIKSEADRMTNIIRHLLDFARRGTPQRTLVDFQHVYQCVDLLRPLAKKENVELVVTGDKSIIAHVDPAQIQQVFTNLVVNAIQAMPDGGTVSIDFEKRRTHPPGVADAVDKTYCCASIRDEGVGIPEEDLKHLFEPFFTTKDVGEGTGLGLSVSYGIVQDHDGWIDVQSEPGQGSCFTVFLPCN